MGELADIKRQREDVHQQLQDTSGKLDTGRQFFLAAGEKLSTRPGRCSASRPNLPPAA